MEPGSMTDYHASEEDMRQYASLLHDLAIVDYQRGQIIEAIRQWEQAHQVAEDPETTSE